MPSPTKATFPVVSPIVSSSYPILSSGSISERYPSTPSSEATARAVSSVSPVNILVPIPMVLSPETAAAESSLRES